MNPMGIKPNFERTFRECCKTIGGECFIDLRLVFCSKSFHICTLVHHWVCSRGLLEVLLRLFEVKPMVKPWSFSAGYFWEGYVARDASKCSWPFTTLLEGRRTTPKTIGCVCVSQEIPFFFSFHKNPREEWIDWLQWGGTPKELCFDNCHSQKCCLDKWCCFPIWFRIDRMIFFVTCGLHVSLSLLHDMWATKNPYPPKLNITPEKLWLEDYFPIGKESLFQWPCFTSGGYYFPLNPGRLIAILTIVYCNPHKSV